MYVGVCISQLCGILLFSYKHNGSANCGFNYYFNGNYCAGRNVIIILVLWSGQVEQSQSEIG